MGIETSQQFLQRRKTKGRCSTSRDQLIDQRSAWWKKEQTDERQWRKGLFPDLQMGEEGQVNQVKKRGKVKRKDSQWKVKGRWGSRKELPAPAGKPYLINSRILYQFSIPKLSAPKMKENRLKDGQSSKAQENHQNKGQAKGGRPNSAKKHSQEMRAMEKQSQFGFTKKERPGRGRPKLSVNERKVQCQTTQLPSEDASRKEAPKAHSFPEKLQSIDRYTGTQQYAKNKLPQKRKNSRSIANDRSIQDISKEYSLQLSRQSKPERRTKRQMKETKIVEKIRKESLEPKQDFSEEGTSHKKENGQQFPEELLSIFREKYPFYLISDSIVFPIQDSLLILYPELAANSTKDQSSIPEDIIEKLPPTFDKELQIWNILIENSSFFELTEQFTVSHIKKIFSDTNGELCQKLWKQFNRFYLNDILYHHYEESNNEDYYSFISLWRYTDENGFLDRLFHTCWNKFIHFYIRLVKPHYLNPAILAELNRFEELLGANLERGQFQLPSNYPSLLAYLVLLTNMCFETHTFKTLINGKMLFFRDNNKIKNQLLDEKKNHQSSLWELKEADKALGKKDKMAKKALKKENKSNNQEKLDQIQREIDEILEGKVTIQTRREFFTQKIIQIDNKIYELCCLPEFSNVWLLGEDRNRNLYWFVREKEDAIYRENRESGVWGMIRGRNIDNLHKSLNPKGIRQRKLYEKILYYKQLGYIKVDVADPSTLMEIEDDIFCKQVEENHNKCENFAGIEIEESRRVVYDSNEFDKFTYGQYNLATPYVVKLMILKSEWMMTKYLYERNSKWTAEELRQEYITRMSNIDLANLSIYDNLTRDLRHFNERICVVEINIKLCNESDEIQVKTRKIQTKIWGINEKYKHFWYDYSRKCQSLSDLHFLVSVLYLTIERYVTKTRKPNNTKYFYKTLEFGEQQELCELCQTAGEMQNCLDCDAPFHLDCLIKHCEECPRKLRQVEDFVEFGLPSDPNS